MGPSNLLKLRSGPEELEGRSDAAWCWRVKAGGACAAPGEQPAAASSPPLLSALINLPLPDGRSERCGAHACVEMVTRENCRGMLFVSCCCRSQTCKAFFFHSYAIQAYGQLLPIMSSLVGAHLKQW